MVIVQVGVLAGDMSANALGTGDEQKKKKKKKKTVMERTTYTIKIFFYPTKKKKYRPNLLGDEIYMQVLKDYNGNLLVKCESFFIY